MEINFENMTVVLDGKSKDIYALASNLASRNLAQVVKILGESNDELPRILKTRATRIVLNEFVKIAKELPLTAELLHRLNWYTEYSDYQVNKLFNTFADCQDTRFNKNACVEKFKISFWLLVIINSDTLNISKNTIVEISKTKKGVHSFEEYCNLLDTCLYDFDGAIDCVNINEFPRVMSKSATVIELRELADVYKIDVPKRLNRSQLVETIVQRLQEEGKFNSEINEKLKAMKVVTLQRFAKDNNIKASTELKKEAVIDFIIKGVENDQSNLRSLPEVDLVVLEEEKFEMKPEYIREIDSRYFYEFDEDGEIISMSDAEELKAQIEQLKQQAAEEQERITHLQSIQENVEEVSNTEYEERVKELERQIEVLSTRGNEEEKMLAEQEARLQEMFNERINQMMLQNEETEEIDAIVLNGNYEMEQIVETTVDVNEEIVYAEEQVAYVEVNATFNQNLLAQKEAELAAKEAEHVAKEAELAAELASKEAQYAAETSEREARMQAELAQKEARMQAELAQKEIRLQNEIAQREARMQSELASKEARLYENSKDEIRRKEMELSRQMAAKESELRRKEAEFARMEAELSRKSNELLRKEKTLNSEKVGLFDEIKPITARYEDHIYNADVLGEIRAINFQEEVEAVHVGEFNNYQTIEIKSNPYQSSFTTVGEFVDYNDEEFKFVDYSEGDKKSKKYLVIDDPIDKTRMKDLLEKVRSYDEERTDDVGEISIDELNRYSSASNANPNEFDLSNVIVEDYDREEVKFVDYSKGDKNNNKYIVLEEEVIDKEVVSELLKKVEFEVDKRDEDVEHIVADDLDKRDDFY